MSSNLPALRTILIIAVQDLAQKSGARVFRSRRAGFVERGESKVALPSDEKMRAP